MIVLEERMHALDLLRRQALQDEQLIVAAIELRARLARRVDLHRLRARQRLAVLDVVDAEALAQIAKDERTVLLHLEVRRHVLLVEQMVVDLDLRVGAKVVGQQHHRNVDVAQLVDLRGRGRKWQ